MSRWPAAVLAGLLAALLALAPGARAQDQVTLSVYTALEPEETDRYAARFNEQHPSVRIAWTRGATGEITDRLLAEKEAPQADVVWGLAATSMLLLERAGVLQPHPWPGLERFDPRFRDPAEPPAWVGMDASVGALCVNPVETAGRKLSPPISWHDLTRTEYEGHLAMPDPRVSGTGFLTVSAWLQMLGEEGGWAYMDALHPNIRAYTHSGSKPCTQAARGEVAIGISTVFRAARTKAGGAPIEIVLPAEGVGWDIGAVAMVAGTARAQAAGILVEWAIGDAAMGMYNEGHAVLAVPAVAKPVDLVPAELPTRMLSNDFGWAATRRAEILAEWYRRYGDKVEPSAGAAK